MRFLQKNFKILLFRKRHSKTFLEHIKPIFILGKIYGCIFFDLDKKPLLTNILISAPIPLAYIFSCIDCWFVHTVLPTIPSSKYQLVSDSLFVVGCTVNAILQSYNYFVKRGQHKEFFLDAQKTNEILGVGIRYGINYSFIYFTALLSVLTTSLVVIGYYSPMITFDFTHIAYVIIHVQALLVSEFISFTLLREVRRQFAVINEKLWIIIERIDLKDESVVETDQLLAQHKRLCKYCLEFNSFLGVTLLIDFAVNIVMMVQGTHFVFFVIINLVDGKNVDVYVGFVRCIKMLLGWVIVVLKLLSWIGVQKEADQTSTYVHDIWNKLADKNKLNGMTKHLQLLSLQLHNSKLYFTAYNFFEVNWTLLQKTISAVATYVVILIQFELSSNNKNNALAGNVTAK